MHALLLPTQLVPEIELRLLLKLTISTFLIRIPSLQLPTNLSKIQTAKNFLRRFSLNTLNIQYSPQVLLLVKKKLIENNINDWLYDFLLNEKKENTPLLFSQRFHFLKETVDTANKDNSLEKYLKEEWYNKDCEVFEAHKSTQRIYYGYWCFEAGAVAKILHLDDSSLKDVPYYPYDLVHYK